jgi:hypothetical protein
MMASSSAAVVSGILTLCLSTAVRCSRRSGVCEMAGGRVGACSGRGGDGGAGGGGVRPATRRKKKKKKKMGSGRDLFLTLPSSLPGPLDRPASCLGIHSSTRRPPTWTTFTQAPLDAPARGKAHAPRNNSLPLGMRRPDRGFGRRLGGVPPPHRSPSEPSIVLRGIDGTVSG